MQLRLKHQLRQWIHEGRWDEIEALAEANPAVPAALKSHLFHHDMLIRFRAAEAMGRSSSRVLRTDPARVQRLLNQLVWTLNDESGMTGWGSPAAIAEIIRHDQSLTAQYLPILVSYLSNDEVAVGNDVLVAGVAYGIGRVAEGLAHLCHSAVPALRLLLRSPCAAVRANAACALGYIGDSDVADELRRLHNDMAAVTIYRDGRVLDTDVASVASRALCRLLDAPTVL